MPNVFAVLGAFAPRLALVAVWFGTPLVDRAFADGIGPFFGPLLGLLVVPYTVLGYVLVAGSRELSNGWVWLAMLLGLALDLRSLRAVLTFLASVPGAVVPDMDSEYAASPSAAFAETKEA